MKIYLQTFWYKYICCMSPILFFFFFMIFFNYTGVGFFFFINKSSSIGIYCYSNGSMRRVNMASEEIFEYFFPNSAFRLPWQLIKFRGLDKNGMFSRGLLKEHCVKYTELSFGLHFLSFFVITEEFLSQSPLRMNTFYENHDKLGPY